MLNFWAYLICIVLQIIQVSCSDINNLDILFTLLNTIEFNRYRSLNNYRYPKSVLRFPIGLFVLTNTHVYEYIHIKLKFLLPSIETIKNCYKYNPYAEVKFNEIKIYLDSINC